MDSLSHCSLYFALPASLSFCLMGLETGVGFLFVAFFCSYVFMPPAGLNLRPQIKGTDIRNQCVVHLNCEIDTTLQRTPLNLPPLRI